MSDLQRPFWLLPRLLRTLVRLNSPRATLHVHSEDLSAFGVRSMMQESPIRSIGVNACDTNKIITMQSSVCAEFLIMTSRADAWTDGWLRGESSYRQPKPE